MNIPHFFHQLFPILICKIQDKGSGMIRIYPFSLCVNKAVVTHYANRISLYIRKFLSVYGKLHCFHTRYLHQCLHNRRPAEYFCNIIHLTVSSVKIHSQILLRALH